MAKIEIEGGGVRISIEAEDPPGAETGPDWSQVIHNVAGNWKEAVSIVAAVRRQELTLEATRAKFEKAIFQGNAAGFQIEQADEWRNGTLPGGDAG